MVLTKIQPFLLEKCLDCYKPLFNFQSFGKVDFHNFADSLFFWRSRFSEVLTLPFRQCFCCIFRKCSLGPRWIENLNTKTADLRLAPAEIWWVAPFVSIGLAQPSKICFHPFLPPNPLSFICPSVPLSLSSLSSLFFLLAHSMHFCLFTHPENRFIHIFLDSIHKYIYMLIYNVCFSLSDLLHSV